MKFIFWLSIIWIAYTYVGYMLILYILNLFNRSKNLARDIEPNVTMIIAARNEEKSIERKIKNILELDYPKNKLEVIIVSDASTDRTNEIVARYESDKIQLLKMDKRRGKTEAQNAAVSKASGDILVFSDATTIYKEDALRKLMRNFTNKKVGAVGGEEVFIVKKGSSIGKEASMSWDYEKNLRRLESRFNTLIGVSGCIFAIRRELYKKLDENLIEDFALPLLVVEQGYKVRLEKEAIGYEETVTGPKEEFIRKTRIVSGGISVLLNLRRLLNPLKHPKLAFQLISHKICRWLSPVFLIVLFAANIFLLNEGLFFKIFLVLQILGYGIASMGLFTKNIKIVKIAFYFCLVNVAALVGIIKFMFNDNKVIWNPIR